MTGNEGDVWDIRMMVFSGSPWMAYGRGEWLLKEFNLPSFHFYLFTIIQTNDLTPNQIKLSVHAIINHINSTIMPRKSKSNKKKGKNYKQYRPDVGDFR